MRRVLSAAFDEVLMGWPAGWTTVCGCVGPCNCNRLDRLRLCGNGVVPVQAAWAFLQLAERLGLIAPAVESEAAQCA